GACTAGSVGTCRVNAIYSGDANYASTRSACADATEAVAVTQATVPVTTQVNPATVPLGGTFTDTATLGARPAGAPVPTGTVTFNVYSPADPTCAGAPNQTSTNPVNGAGTTATSGTFNANAVGTYRVIA